MDELFLDFCFLILLMGVIFVKLILPIGLIILGIILGKKDKVKGTIMIVFGSLYLLFNIVRMILNYIVYGFK